MVPTLLPKALMVIGSMAVFLILLVYFIELVRPGMALIVRQAGQTRVLHKGVAWGLPGRQFSMVYMGPRELEMTFDPSANLTWQGGDKASGTLSLSVKPLVDEAGALAAERYFGDSIPPVDAYPDFDQPLFELVRETLAASKEGDETGAQLTSAIESKFAGLTVLSCTWSATPSS